MAVTIEMIETKEFKVIARGYDPKEVDGFLDDIMDEMARLMDEKQSLQQQLAAAKAAAAALPPPRWCALCRPILTLPPRQLLLPPPARMRWRFWKWHRS